MTFKGCFPIKRLNLINWQSIQEITVSSVSSFNLQDCHVCPSRSISQLPIPGGFFFFSFFCPSSVSIHIICLMKHTLSFSSPPLASSNLLTWHPLALAGCLSPRSHNSIHYLVLPLVHIDIQCRSIIIIIIISSSS